MQKEKMKLFRLDEFDENSGSFVGIYRSLEEAQRNARFNKEIEPGQVYSEYTIRPYMRTEYSEINEYEILEVDSDNFESLEDMCDKGCVVESYYYA